MQELITFRGKKYRYHAWEITKASANATARNLRKKGFGARVVKASDSQGRVIYRIYKGRADRR